MVITVLVGLLVGWSYTTGYSKADSAWKLRWTQRDLTDERATLERTVAERKEEQRRQQKTEEEKKYADQLLEQARFDAAAADRAADGLRNQLTQLREQLAGSEARRISAVTSAGQAKKEASLLLAQLLSESDEMAGKFAKEADDNYIAGNTCERIYDEVTEKNKLRP